MQRTKLHKKCHWEQTIAQLHQLGLARADSQLRISFAYLFRVCVHGQYMLIPSERRPNVYQPIGGVYHYHPSEIKFLADHYQVKNEHGEIPDISKSGDYRLCVPGIYLQPFLQRFDQTAARESICNVGREFVEEAIHTGMFSFMKIKYRYCGRHISSIQFSDYCNCYKLLMADIVELLPDKYQFDVLTNYLGISSPNYLFATSEIIRNRQWSGCFSGCPPIIAEHAWKILIENENILLKDPNDACTYEVEL